MSAISQPDIMFAVEEDGSLVIERAAFFRVERCGDEITHAGDLVHFETSKMHRIWRLTGERDRRGSYRGIWPD